MTEAASIPVVDQENLIIWLDLETTGLDQRADIPLEVGIVITDNEGTEIAAKRSLILHRDYAVKIRELNDYVREMHTNSGLLVDLEKLVADEKTNAFLTRSPQRVAKALVNWLVEMGVEPGRHPMAGSTIQFDRKFVEKYMPELNGFFGYRHIDVSTLKEICRRLNRPVFDARPQDTKNHRVIADCRASIIEYKHYADNFLLW